MLGTFIGLLYIVSSDMKSKAVYWAIIFLGDAKS